jgi:hypothetical protein
MATGEQRWKRCSLVLSASGRTSGLGVYGLLVMIRVVVRVWYRAVKVGQLMGGMVAGRLVVQGAGNSQHVRQSCFPHTVSQQIWMGWGME